MNNKYKYTIKFVLIEKYDIFMGNYYTDKIYHYNSIDDFIFDLKYDLKKDFENCVEMLVMKND